MKYKFEEAMEYAENLQDELFDYEEDARAAIAAFRENCPKDFWMGEVDIRKCNNDGKTLFRPSFGYGEVERLIIVEHDIFPEDPFRDTDLMVPEQIISFTYVLESTTDAYTNCSQKTLLYRMWEETNQSRECIDDFYNRKYMEFSTANSKFSDPDDYANARILEEVKRDWLIFPLDFYRCSQGCTFYENDPDAGGYFQSNVVLITRKDRFLKNRFPGDKVWDDDKHLEASLEKIREDLEYYTDYLNGNNWIVTAEKNGEAIEECKNCGLAYTCDLNTLEELLIRDLPKEFHEIIEKGEYLKRY